MLSQSDAMLAPEGAPDVGVALPSPHPTPHPHHHQGGGRRASRVQIPSGADLRAAQQLSSAPSPDRPDAVQLVAALAQGRPLPPPSSFSSEPSARCLEPSSLEGRHDVTISPLAARSIFSCRRSEILDPKDCSRFLFPLLFSSLCPFIASGSCPFGFRASDTRMHAITEACPAYRGQM